MKISPNVPYAEYAEYLMWDTIISKYLYVCISLNKTIFGDAILPLSSFCTKQNIYSQYMWLNIY